MKKKKVKGKIIFAVCLVLFAAAMIAALIAIDNANKDSQSGNSNVGGNSFNKVELPVIDGSDLIQ